MNLYLIDRQKRNLSEDFDAYRYPPDHITRIFPDYVMREYPNTAGGRIPYRREEYSLTYTLRKIGFRDSRSNVDEIFTFYAEESIDNDEALRLFCERQGYEVGRNNLNQREHCQYDRHRNNKYYNIYRYGYSKGFTDYRSSLTPFSINNDTKWEWSIEKPIPSSKPPEKIFEESLIDDEGNLKQSISN